MELTVRRRADHRHVGGRDASPGFPTGPLAELITQAIVVQL